MKTLPRLLFVLMALASTSTSAGLMSTSGTFQVASGNATYQIDLAAPPGVAGVAPQMSLQYSSQGGNGTLGVGWELGGQSSISRCARNRIQDSGIIEPIKYDTSDRLCIDGLRLWSVEGTYGVAGSKYRTEMEGFSLISMKLGAAGAPPYFEVKTKSGETHTYGGGTGYVYAGGTTTIVRLWALTKVSDVKGNEMTFSYTKDTTSGAYYLSEISYTANPGLGKFAKNKFVFDYDTRPDVIELFEAGYLVRVSKRLSRVRMHDIATDTLYREYRLAYTTSPATKQSQIISIQECAPFPACLPPVSFTWGNHTNAFVNGGTLFTGVYGGFDDDPDRIYSGDFDGDGIGDLLLGPDSSGDWGVLRGNGTSLTVAGNWITGTYGNWKDNGKRIRVADINGDGRSDVILGPSSSGQWFGLRSTGSGFVNMGQIGTGYGNFFEYPDDIRVADFNADGLADLLIGPDNSGNWYSMRSNGTTLDNPGLMIGNTYAEFDDDYDRIRIVDMDGDGRTDVLLGPSSNGTWYVLRANNGTTFDAPGPAWATGAFAGWDDQKRIRVAEVNGDGLPDLIIGPERTGPASSQGNWYVMRSTGKSLLNSGIWRTGSYSSWYNDSDRVRSLDVNGDGLSDVLLGPNTEGKWFVLRSTGTSLEDDGAWLTGVLGTWWDEGDRMREIDYTGDGLADVLIGPSTAGTWYGVKNNVRKGMITQILTGTNDVVNIAYKPLTDSTVYVRDAGATYPLMDVQVPMWVVSDTAAQTGTVGLAVTTYRYGGLRSDQRGRGLLGFRWEEATNLQTNITKRNEYSQTFPYTGMLTLSRTSIPGGGSSGKLSEESYVYGCKNPALPSSTTTTCVDASGNRYAPYLAQKIESRWDLNGVALPSTTTTQAYDGYGNLTSSQVTTSDGHSKSILNTYTNDDVNWILGRLNKTVVQSTSP